MREVVQTERIPFRAHKDQIKIAHGYMKRYSQDIGNILTAVTDILQPQDIDQLEKYSFSGPVDD